MPSHLTREVDNITRVPIRSLLNDDDDDDNNGSGGAGGGLGPAGGGPSNSGGTGPPSSNKDISSEFNFLDYVLIISSNLLSILSEIIVNLPPEI